MNRLRAVNRLLIRSYSAPSTPEVTAEAARKASIPLQVALRRTQNGTVDAEHDRARYDLMIAKGAFAKLDGPPPSYETWVANRVAYRRRLRGLRRTKVGKSEYTTTVVGQKIYLPNTIFRFMRNHTPAGKPYNPYEATFRIPPSVTKNDVRSYLMAVYGIKCTYIRTDNYIAPLKRTRVNAVNVQLKRRHGGTTTYKRAIVGLEEPFVYPQAKEDLTQLQREERADWMEKMFQATTVKQAIKTQRVDARTGSVMKKQNKHRGKILELVMKKREERRDALGNAVKELVATGASPFGPGMVHGRSSSPAL